MTVGEAFILVDIVPLIIIGIVLVIWSARKDKDDSNHRSDKG